MALIDSIFSCDARSRFGAHMRHEIRTPLNAVLGLTHLLDLSTLDATQADLVDKLRTAGIGSSFWFDVTLPVAAAPRRAAARARCSLQAVDLLQQRPETVSPPTRTKRGI